MGVKKSPSRRTTIRPLLLPFDFLLTSSSFLGWWGVSDTISVGASVVGDGMKMFMANSMGLL